VANVNDNDGVYVWMRRSCLFENHLQVWVLAALTSTSGAKDDDGSRRSAKINKEIREESGDNGGRRPAKTNKEIREESGDDGSRRSAKKNKEIRKESGNNGLKDGNIANGDSSNKGDKYKTDGSYNTEEEEQFIGSLMKKYKLVRSDDAQI
jgi:hypothetical protein